MPDDDERPDAVIDALWARALHAWDDDRPHAALLDHAMRNESLPDLAGRYRALVGDPVRGARAQKRLDALVAAATQMLLSMKTPKPERPPIAITLSAAGICVVLLSWLAWVVLGHR